MTSKLFFRFLGAPIFWLGSIVLVAGIGANLTAEDEPEIIDTSKAPAKVLREGTRIEGAICECRSDGNRLSIQTNKSDPRSLLALENLTAQRVLQAIGDDPNDKTWKITGTVTEFQDRNYILLERATRVSK